MPFLLTIQTEELVVGMGTLFCWNYQETYFRSEIRGFSIQDLVLETTLTLGI